MGLEYLRARWYDGEVGRFTQRDPLSEFSIVGQVPEEFAYADDNPVNRVDPLGLFSNVTIAQSYGYTTGSDYENFRSVVWNYREKSGWLKLLQDAHVGDRVELWYRSAPPSWQLAATVAFHCNNGHIELEFVGSPPPGLYFGPVPQDLRGFTDELLEASMVPGVIWRNTRISRYKLISGFYAQEREYGNGNDALFNDVPEFVSHGVTVGPRPIAPFALGGTEVVDMYGNTYFVVFAGVSEGSPIEYTYAEGYMGTLVYGGLLPSGYATEEEIRGALTGPSFSARAGLIELFGLASPLFSPNKTAEYGFGGTAGVSAGVSWGIPLAEKRPDMAWVEMTRASAPPPAFFYWDLSLDYYSFHPFDTVTNPCECQ